MSSLAPTQLYLARHGRTSWNELRRWQGLTDVPLDDVGRAQALGLADVLRGRVDAVIASDLLRASETAQIIADALTIPVLAVDEDLRERGYGVFEGLTMEECMERYPDAWAARELDRNFEVPGAEPHKLVLARMRRALDRAVALFRDGSQRGLIISHGSSLRMFLEPLIEGPVCSIRNMEYREVLHDQHGFRLAAR